MFTSKKNSVISTPVLNLLNIKDSNVLGEAGSRSQCALQHNLAAMPTTVQSTPADYPPPAWELCALAHETQYWCWREE